MLAHQVSFCQRLHFALFIPGGFEHFFLVFELLLTSEDLCWSIANLGPTVLLAAEAGDFVQSRGEGVHCEIRSSVINVALSSGAEDHRCDANSSVHGSWSFLKVKSQKA